MKPFGVQNYGIDTNFAMPSSRSRDLDKVYGAFRKLGRLIGDFITKRLPALRFVRLALQYMRNSGGPQRSLPLTADPRDGTVGSTRVHPRPAETAGNAQV